MQKKIAGYLNSQTLQLRIIFKRKIIFFKFEIKTRFFLSSFLSFWMRRTYKLAYIVMPMCKPVWPIICWLGWKLSLWPSRPMANAIVIIRMFRSNKLTSTGGFIYCYFHYINLRYNVGCISYCCAMWRFYHTISSITVQQNENSEWIDCNRQKWYLIQWYYHDKRQSLNCDAISVHQSNSEHWWAIKKQIKNELQEWQNKEIVNCGYIWV